MAVLEPMVGVESNQPPLAKMQQVLGLNLKEMKPVRLGRLWLGWFRAGGGSISCQMVSGGGKNKYATLFSACNGRKQLPARAVPTASFPNDAVGRSTVCPPAADAPYQRLSYFLDTPAGLCLVLGTHNPSSEPPLPCRGHLHLGGAGGPAARAAEGDGHGRPGEGRAAPVPR